jgi:hypothetical protein
MKEVKKWDVNCREFCVSRHILKIVSGEPDNNNNNNMTTKVTP